LRRSSTRVSGVAISGAVGQIHGDVVGRDKIGLDEEGVIALLEARGVLIKKVSKEIRSLKRGGPRNRDVARMSKYLELFRRSAFEIPCIFEGSLIYLDKAIDQIQTAFGTGRVLLRDFPHDVVYEVPRRSEFETEPYREALRQISAMLLLLKQETSFLIGHIEANENGFNMREVQHMEFLICHMIGSGVDRSVIVTMIESMDRIDLIRNAMNEMLKQPKIPVSSALLKTSSQMREHDWGNFYLRCHKEINSFLAGDTRPSS
jgi:hypothetical protein